MTVKHDVFRLALGRVNDVHDQRVLAFTFEYVPLETLDFQPLCVLIDKVDSLLEQTVGLELGVEQERQIGDSYKGLKTFHVPWVPLLADIFLSCFLVHLYAISQ